MPGLLILAHAPLASALRSVAGHVYPEGLARVLALDVPPDWSAEQTEQQARLLLDGAGQPQTLVLVDVCGATPCNVAQRLVDADPSRFRVVAGVNVPMLWRAMCYSSEELDALVEKVLTGGHRGVMPMEAAPCSDTPQGSPSAP